MTNPSTRPYLLITALLFGLMTIGQLYRASTAVTVVVGSFTLPVYASWIAALLFGSLCVWALTLLRRPG